MRVAVVFRRRQLSYDLDWLDALERHFDAIFVDIDAPEKNAEEIRRADLVVFMHATNFKPPVHVPGWIEKAVLDRRGKLVWFMANEFRDIEGRLKIIDRLGTDFIASMLPLRIAREWYGPRAVAMPHALNERIFKPVLPRDKRPHPIGFRGSVYPDGLGDRDRARIIELAARIPGSDVKTGGAHMMDRQSWAQALNTWRATVATESGKVGAKCLSSRHLDAIGTGTVQIMPRGDFNGILLPEHYIPCDLDKGLDEPMEIARDRGGEIAEAALDHILKNHTYDHRMTALKGELA